MRVVNSCLLKIIGSYDWYFIKKLLFYLYNEFFKEISERYLFEFIDILKSIFEDFPSNQYVNCVTKFTRHI